MYFVCWESVNLCVWLLCCFVGLCVVTCVKSSKRVRVGGKERAMVFETHWCQELAILEARDQQYSDSESANR